MRKYLVPLIAGAAAVAVAAGGGAMALATTSSPSLGERAYFGCVKLKHVSGVPRRSLFDISERPITCPGGSFKIEWNQDQNGKLVASQSMNASNIPTQLQYIGGTILQTTAGHGATNVLQIFLPKGTYLLNADLKFDRSVTAATGAPDTYGYLALWTGATSSTTFTDFSQGAGTFTTGPLPRLVNGSDVIDAVASGSHILIVPAGGEYLNLSAFAYNADESGGPYAGCVGTACTTTDLSQAGSVVVTNADLSAIQVRP